MSDASDGVDATDGVDASAAGPDTADDPPLLEVTGLAKHFSESDGFLDRLLGEGGRIRAVDGVDLVVEAGEVLGVVGESGCGKSTLAETVVGLNAPTAGTVRFRGEEISDLSARAMRPYRREIQMIFQDPLASLNPRRTVGQILRAPMKVHDIGSDAAERERLAGNALEDVGLDPEHVSRYPHQFSGGQQQRIAIARSLTVDPSLLIADEPVSSLDVSVQAQILGLLDRLRRERDIAMVFIAHDLSVVRHVADRVAVMYLGEIVETAPADQLFGDPAHPYTKSLLSAVPRIGRQRSVDDRVLLRGTPPSPSSPPAGCRFHTRCPAVIPPEDWPGTQAQFLEAFQFATRLREGDVDVETVENRLRSEGTTPTPEAVATRLLAGHLNADVDEYPPPVQATLEEAVGAYVQRHQAAAVDILDGALSTPCRAETPRRTPVGESHVATCHRVDAELPGDPDHLQY